MKHRPSFFGFLTVAVLMAASVLIVSAQESDGIELNKRPLRDFGNELKRDIESKKVDLSAPFLVEMRGTLDKKGRLEAVNSRFMRTEGDPVLVETAKLGILAISDAGYFEYIRSLASKDFSLLIEQGASDFQVRVDMEYESETRAKTIESMLKLVLNISLAQKRDPNATPADLKDLRLLEATKVKSEGRGVVISFRAPSADIQKLIAEELTDQTKNGQ